MDPEDYIGKCYREKCCGGYTYIKVVKVIQPYLGGKPHWHAETVLIYLGGIRLDTRTLWTEYDFPCFIEITPDEYDNVHDIVEGSIGSVRELTDV